MALVEGTLSEICLLVTDGTHDSPKLQESGVPFIKGKHISSGSVDFSNCDFITKKDHEKAIRRVKPQRGDILFSNIGSVGDTARVNSDIEFSIKNVALFRADTECVDEGYLYYLVRSPVFREGILGLRSGAAQPFLSLESLRSYKFLYEKNKLAQQNISRVLSTYDDLIENNQRRIRVLEDMAQSLYREWFVHFRFPGHEKTKMTDSPLGPIPQGWERVPFSNIVKSSLGGGWGEDTETEKETENVAVIRGTDFDDLKSGSVERSPLRWIDNNSFVKRRLEPFDLVVENSINAKTRSAGSTLLITDGLLNRFSSPVIAASFCKVYKFKTPQFAVLAHLHMKNICETGDMAFYQNVAANGIANFQSNRFLETETLVIPRDDALKEKMLSQLSLLNSSVYADQVTNLRRQRDLLLPKLIAGEIDLSAATSKTEEAA